MRWSVMALIGLLLAPGAASAADFKTLRNLQAPPPVAVPPLPTDTKVNPVRLSKVVLQPRQGEGWALLYTSFPLRGEDSPAPPEDRILAWEDGRSESETASFSRIFDEELRAAGFKTAGANSLFEQATVTDLQVGVLVDDIKGRFCRDCPHVFQRDKIAAVVTMSARWEVYSTLRSAVVAKVDTATGATWRKSLNGASTQVMYDAFRENVRALLATQEFRQAVATSSAPAPRPALSPISFSPAATGKRPIINAATSVAAIFAGQSLGTGFLVSRDGYLLTNDHVVSGANYVKVRWSDGAETVGEVVRSDRRRDIALIKVDAGARQPLALRPAPADLGEAVYAIGTPLDPKFQGSVTKGIVSATRVYEGLSYIQSDVTVNGGNSGGPLLDENGAVIGVTVSGYDIGGAPVGINLFIPIADALKALALTPAP